MSTTNKDEIKTPAFDALPPQRQLFIKHYVIRFNKREAGREAGYKSTGADLLKQVNALLRIPAIQEAQRELIALQQHEAGQRKHSVINRLYAQSTVALSDLTKWDVNEKQYVLLSPEEVEPEFKHCLGMVTVSREGKAVFNQGSADNSKKLLAEYMLWSKETQDNAPAVSFSFSSLKREAYVKPDH